MLLLDNVLKTSLLLLLNLSVSCSDKYFCIVRLLLSKLTCLYQFAVLQTELYYVICRIIRSWKCCCIWWL